MVIDIVVTGLSANSVPYVEALGLQRAIHQAVVDGTAPDTLLLLEHPSVYTAGKRTEDWERPSDGTPVIDVDRGGKITWHGPGQLVGYPILRLSPHSGGTAVGMGIDVVGYVRRLEGMLIGVLAELGIDAGRIEGRSGVWIGYDRPVGIGFEPAQKIAAIGIRVSRGVSMHGFALNCSNDFDAYEKIVACGILDAGVTSISRVLGREVTPEDVVPLVSAHFEQAMAVPA